MTNASPLPGVCPRHASIKFCSARVSPPAASEQPPVVQPRQRLTGDLAAAFSAYVVALYTGPDDMSISAICEKTGRSYGNIHRILTAAKVTMRNRGYQRPSRATEPVGEHRDDDVLIRGASADMWSPTADSAEVDGAAGRST